MLSDGVIHIYFHPTRPECMDTPVKTCGAKNVCRFLMEND